MAFRASFSCLWCGTAHTTRGPDDLEGWEQSESVLQRVIRTEEHLDALAASRRRIDSLLLGADLLPT